MESGYDKVFRQMDDEAMRRFAEERDRVNRARIRAILDIAARWSPALRGSVRVLEYGCNTGSATAELAHAGHEAVGVDVNEQLLDVARERFAGVENLSFLAIDGTLPFDDASFDLVFSSEVIEHVPLDQRATYLAEFRRVMKPDGLGYLSFPNFWYPLEQHHGVPFHHWVERVRRHGGYRYEDIPSKYALARQLRRDFRVHDIARDFLRSDYARARFSRTKVAVARVLARTPLAPQAYLVLEPR